MKGLMKGLFRRGYLTGYMVLLAMTLTLALARHKWGKARPTLPSRFLYEITGQADNPNYPPGKCKRKKSRPTAKSRKKTGAGPK